MKCNQNVDLGVQRNISSISTLTLRSFYGAYISSMTIVHGEL